MAGWDGLATAGLIVVGFLCAVVLFGLVALAVGLLGKRPGWAVLGALIVVSAVVVVGGDLATYRQISRDATRAFAEADAARDLSPLPMPDSILLDGLTMGHFWNLGGCGGDCDDPTLWLMEAGRFLELRGKDGTVTRVMFAQGEPRCLTETPDRGVSMRDLPDRMRLRGMCLMSRSVAEAEADVAVSEVQVKNLPGFGWSGAKALVLTRRDSGEELDRLLIGHQKSTRSFMESMFPDLRHRGIGRDLGNYGSGRIPALFQAMEKADRDTLIDIARAIPISAEVAQAGLLLGKRDLETFLHEVCRYDSAAHLSDDLRDQLWQAVGDREPKLLDSYVFRTNSACNPANRG